MSTKAIELLTKDAKELLEASAFETRKKDEKKQVSAKASVKNVVQKFVDYAATIKTDKDAYEKIKTKFDVFDDKVVELVDDHLSEDKMMVNFVQKFTKVLQKNLERIKKEQTKLSKDKAETVAKKVDKYAEKLVKDMDKKPRKKSESKKSVRKTEKKTKQTDEEYLRKQDEEHLIELGYMTCSDKECSCWDFTDFDDLSSCSDCSSSEEEEPEVKKTTKKTEKKCKDGKCTIEPKVVQFDDEVKSVSTSVSNPEPEVFRTLFKSAIAKIQTASKPDAEKLYKIIKAKFDKLSKSQQQEFQEDLELVELIFM